MAPVHYHKAASHEKDAADDVERQLALVWLQLEGLGLEVLVCRPFVVGVNGGVLPSHLDLLGLQLQVAYIG